jgi:clan AA aspartic protease
MIQGTVNARLEPTLRLQVRTADGTEKEIEFVVDTGFSGKLALPTSVVSLLGLHRRSGIHATFADGSSKMVDTCQCEVFWFGKWRQEIVSVLGEDSLLGMGLLADRELRVEGVAGGLVSVLPRSWIDAIESEFSPR